MQTALLGALKQVHKRKNVQIHSLPPPCPPANPWTYSSCDPFPLLLMYFNLFPLAAEWSAILPYCMLCRFGGGGLLLEAILYSVPSTFFSSFSHGILCEIILNFVEFFAQVWTTLHFVFKQNWWTIFSVCVVCECFNQVTFVCNSHDFVWTVTADND